MNDFPQLNTGAVAQYPLRTRVEYATRVLRFANGKEQRFRKSRSGVKRWVIRLDSLTDDEADRIRAFFDAQQGRAGDFQFVDPADGTTYPSCSFDQDECRLSHASEERAEIVLVIKENLPE